jgi:hypothetical protein
VALGRFATTPQGQFDNPTARAALAPVSLALQQQRCLSRRNIYFARDGFSIRLQRLCFSSALIGISFDNTGDSENMQSLRFL